MKRSVSEPGLKVLKMFTVQFSLLPAIFFELPITPTFFRFPLKVRVIGSRLYLLNFQNQHVKSD